MTDDSYEALATELAALLRTAGRAKRHAPHFHGPQGTEPTTMWLLHQLVSGGPVRLTALAGLLDLDVSTISRQVAALEARGWLERHPDPDDRRAVLLHATGAGAELFEEAQRRRVDYLRDLVSGWTPDDRRQLARLLGKLNEEIQRRHAEAGDPTGESAQGEQGETG